MSILLLSNSAPNYHNFFNELAKLYVNDGTTVVVAVDSAFSREENALDNSCFEEIHDFSAFFANHQVNSNILRRYAAYDLNGALLSDFERSQYYEYWGDKADNYFFDRLKSALLSFFESLFFKHHVTMVLYENVSNTFSHYAFFVAKEKGVTYCGLAASRLPGRFAIVSDPLGDDATQMAFEAIRSGVLTVDPNVQQWAKEYIANIERTVPDYMRTNGLDRLGLFRRYFRKDRLRKIGALLRHRSNDRLASFQLGNPLRTHARLLLRNVSRRLKAKWVCQLYDCTHVEEKFLLYPLHFHPESSTSVLAGTYLDEYEVIRNIAFSLPEGLRLYVKDHPSAWAYPTLNFYRKIRRLPNVRILSPDEPTKQLIKASEAVITLTSTVGYEALLLGRQVFLYGRVFYQFHAGVARVGNPAELRDLIACRLAKPAEWDEHYTRDFVCAYFHSTLPGSLNLTLHLPDARIQAESVYRLISDRKC